MKKEILFVTFQYPFKNNAHAKNFIEKVFMLYNYDKNKTLNISITAFNVLKEEFNIKILAEKFPEYLKNIDFIYNFRKYPKYKVFYSVLEFIRCNLIFHKIIKEKKYDFVYLYSEPALLLTMFSVFTKQRYYLDLRGDTMKEFENENKLKVFNYLYRLLVLHLLKKVKKIFAVNSEMGKLYNNISERNDIAVFSNYFNGNNYFYKRRNISNDKIRFVYSGNTAYYQMISKTIKLFLEYNIINHKSELLLLISGNADEVNSLNQEAISHPNIIIKNEKNYAIVNSLLNGCDYAIMLRDNSDVNKYAFPTKFAEYFAAGLPVITTNAIKDIEKIINDTGYGLIININNDFRKEAVRIHEFIQKNNIERSDISNYAMDNLSWNANIERLFNEIITV